MTLKITATAARALARKFGRAKTKGKKVRVTPYFNALKAKGTGTMTTSQRQEYRAMIDKVMRKHDLEMSALERKKWPSDATPPKSSLLKRERTTKRLLKRIESRDKKPKVGRSTRKVSPAQKAKSQKAREAKARGDASSKAQAAVRKHKSEMYALERGIKNLQLRGADRYDEFETGALSANDLLSALVKKSSIRELQKRLAAATTASEKKLFRAALKQKKKLAK